MGATVSASPLMYPSKTTPKTDSDPTFDPQYGFEAQRKERVMKATHDELRSAKIPLKMRDYCAHHFINYKACKKDKFPFLYRCAPEKHAMEQCQYEDQILRMKEFERERRLLERQDRKEKKAARSAHHMYKSEENTEE